MFFEFCKWWYGSGWLEAWRNVPQSISRVSLRFSIPVLLGSLFAPWKQIIVAPGRSIDERFRASIDNLVSRTIGFFVRFLTLLTALVFIGISAVLSLLAALAWPLLPLAVLYFAIKAVTG